MLIDRVATDFRCAGTGFIPGQNVERDLPECRAHREQRDQPARAADQRAAARPALHDELDHQQRRVVLVPRAAGRVDQGVQPTACGSTRPTPGARPSTTRRRRPFSAPATPTRSGRTRASPAGCPASTPRTGSRSTAPGGCPIFRGRTDLVGRRPRGLAGLGHREDRARHALHGDRHRRAATSTGTASRRTGR